MAAQGRERVTSALTFGEAHRAVVRARVAGWLKPSEEHAANVALQTFERRCAVTAVSDAVLTRTGTLSGRAGSHVGCSPLATAELLGEPPQLTTILTRDDRVRENAKALGYVVA